MKYILSQFATLCVCTVAVANSHQTAPRAEEAVQGILTRILPDYSDRFIFQVIPEANGFDVFEIVSDKERIKICGNNGVAMASGLNWYLKHYCHCQLSFCGDQLELPDPLPEVSVPVRRVSPHRYRYFFNYCAFSYTMAWWDWPQWERMIDWMALHGINMPLSITGQEGIWRNVYRRLGLRDEQIKEFFVGPAYLPFGWMGCLDGWGGPLPDHWIDTHLGLQKKILARQRELGMTPVLQGFTGHVPIALKEKYPSAQFHQLPSWGGFPGTYFVDPLHPLFEEIGKAFIEEQTRQFGTDHLYASDTFIEMMPPSNDPKFLHNMGSAIYGAMHAADHNAVWVMQGWIFLNKKDFWKPPQAKAFFGAVPDNRMILLDLACETKPVWNQTDAFYGKPWIWCVLHNYGGRVGLYGKTRQAVKNLKFAMTAPQRGKLSGIGFIMEGFGYNPIIYDLLTDMSWRSEVPDLDRWCTDFVHRRYGRCDRNIEEAWQILQQIIYRNSGCTHGLIQSRPGLRPHSVWANRTVHYAPEELANAWDKLLQGGDSFKSLDTYQFDVVHLARENMAALAEVFFTDVYEAYHAKDREAFDKATRTFLDLIQDMDTLLATRKEFLLGKWLADARRWGTNEKERRLYEWNARNLITLWGPRDSRLHDYAHRQWSGLLIGFYYRRWEILFQRLGEALSQERPFDAEEFEKDIRVWEEEWTHNVELYPSEPQGDPVRASRRMWRKYGSRCGSHARTRLDANSFQN